LFEEGRKLVDTGQIDAACDRFETSLSLDPQVGTRLNLADCREKQGRLGEAYRLFEQAAAEAQSENKPGRTQYAKKHLDALAPKVARVELKLPDTPGLTLRLAGQALPRERWTQVQIVVPGTVAIDASAAGY